ncbi:MAG: DUF5103 domain-containing protein [Bacteroidales bacterium]|jgi:hypothetical protein|nr:DUF5103 domain-containing protein [Bacteroidales bacterium]HNZ42057.1 DUF5103 domain-containing protein [Bacteroidales bacterium]
MQKTFYFKPFTVLIICLFFFSFHALAQKKNRQAKDSIKQNTPDYFSDNYLRAEDYIYKPNIRTVLFYREGFVLTSPIINLDQGEKLVLKFDDLDGDLKRMRYTFIHCDAYWNPSDLMPNEYLRGFYEDDITDVKYSFNTLQKYTHYSLTIPTDVMQPVLSGNYLLKVYMEDEPENVVLTRRFMIVDSKVNITAIVNKPTVVEYRNYKQEVDFSIDKTGYTINNPYQDLKVIVQQNGRWDNAIRNLKPLYIKGEILDYNYEEENVFPGGNVFRYFDIKSTNAYTEYIAHQVKDSIGYEVFLKEEQRKTFKVFVSQKDIKGRQFIKSDDNITDSDIESEYVYVHFFLKYDAPLQDGAIYILGGLTDWSYSKEAKMEYNYEWKGYTATLYLKQGYYNYQYVFLENGKQVGDETLIEGSHYETDNEYTIYVYSRELGENYDVLIGLKQFNTFSK